MSLNEQQESGTDVTKGSLTRRLFCGGPRPLVVESPTHRMDGGICRRDMRVGPKVDGVAEWRVKRQQESDGGLETTGAPSWGSVAGHWLTRGGFCGGRSDGPFGKQRRESAVVPPMGQIIKKNI